MARLLLCSVIVAFSALVLGCNGDSRSASRLRVLHASPDAPDIDIAVGGEVIVENIAFGEASAFATVDAGSVNFLVEVAGGGEVLIDETRTVRVEESFTYAVFDFLGNLSTILFLDDLELDRLDSAKLRVINLSPSIGTVDVFISPPDEDISTSSPDVFDLGLAEAAEGLGAPIAIDQRIRVTPAGSKAVLADSGTLRFGVGQVRTVVILDAPGGGEPFDIVILADRG